MSEGLPTNPKAIAFPTCCLRLPCCSYEENKKKKKKKTIAVVPPSVFLSLSLPWFFFVSFIF